MKMIKFILFMINYLKGGIKFKSKNYIAAKLFYEKAVKYNQHPDNELLYQYYGQTLLYLNDINESFIYLSKAYNVYSKKGWLVADDEEYRLVKDTLDALKYLSDNFNLKIDDFNPDQTIEVERKRANK